MSEHRDDAAPVRAYFEAIRARDVGALARLFHPDAELVTAAGTFRGADAIAGFYRDFAFAIDDLWPEPGPLLVDGDRVAVEISLRGGGSVMPVADFFSLADGLITRIVIYGGLPSR
jgi:ketosteroid isomerase-like protein